MLAQVARAAAEFGDLDQAAAAARSITDPERQVQALAELARESEPEQARSLLALALAVGNWEPLAETLAQISPDAIVVIADEYLKLRT